MFQLSRIFIAREIRKKLLLIFSGHTVAYATCYGITHFFTNWSSYERRSVIKLLQLYQINLEKKPDPIIKELLGGDLS